MNEQQIAEAATFLAAARRSGRPGARLPDPIRPQEIESALKVQRRVIEVLGQEVGGWKCSLPPAPGRINCAPIVKPSIVRTSPAIIDATGATARIEPEVAFAMARDLPRRGTAALTESDVRAAIGETRLVLEILGTRYADPASASWLEMIADCVQNQGLYVGPLLPQGPDTSMAGFPVTVRGSGRTLSTHDGRHGDGHPLRPLVWLANFLAERGDPLRAGQIVTTGSYAGAIEVPLATPLSVQFGDLGIIELTLERKATA
jgi:2-keto-4-pentenoate hydratase